MSNQIVYMNKNGSDPLQMHLEMADLLQMGLIWMDEDGRVLAVNKHLKTELGYAEKSEFTQKTIFQITPYITFLQWKKIWQQLQPDGEYSFPADCMTKQGAIYPVDMRAKLIALPDDRQVCCCLVENIIVSRAYQELLEITSKITRVGSWQWNLMQNRLLLGKEIHALLELPSDFHPSARNLFRFLKKVTNESEFTSFKEKLRHSLKTGQRLEVELSIELPISNQICRFRVVAVPTFREEQTINLYGAFQDISNIALRTNQMYLMEYSVENANEMIYWVEPDGKISYCNEKTCAILGYDRETLYQLEDYAALIADFDEASWLPWEAFKKAKTWQGEIALKTKDGEVIPAYTIANYIHYRGRELACIFTRDLRDEKKKERLAQITQFLLNQASDMIYWFDSDGAIQYANQVFCEKMGYTLQEVLNKRGREFFPEITKDDLENSWELLRSGKGIIGEYVITGKDNRKIPVETSVSLTIFEGKEYCSAIMRDLTERKQQEQALQESNRLLNITTYSLDKTSDMICWTHMDGTIISVNQAFCEKSDYSEAELKTKNFHELFPEDLPEIVETRRQKLEKGEVVLGEAWLTTKGGTLLPVKFHLSATSLDDEPCICGIFADISELKHLEEKLQEQGQMVQMDRHTLDEEPDIAYWKKLDGTLLHANPAFFKKLGYQPEELTALNADQIYENHDWRTSLQRWQTALQVGVRTGDLVLLSKTGERLEGEYQLNIVNFEGETCACYIVREKRQTVTEEEDRLRIAEMTNFMPLRSNAMVFWTDGQGLMVYANEKYCETIGYELEEVVGSNVLKFYPMLTPEQAAMGYEMIRQAKNQNMVGEALITTRSQERIAVEQSSSMVPINGKEYFCIVLYNISEEKRKEQESKRLLDMISFSLDRANEMIYWLDSKGDFLSFNETMSQKLGYTADELRRKGVRALFEENTDEEYAQSWANLQNGQPIEGEGLIYRKDGSRFPIEYYVMPVELEGEQCACGRLTDISERREKEKALRKAFEEIKVLKEKVESENLLLKEDIKTEYNFNNIISTSPAYKPVLKQVDQVAETDATVLILGETGTGKELLARALHQLSRRADRPMIKVNCGALPENLIESELFGHEKGAFTGAYQQKKGRFELADKGTIFLDEIGELHLDLQVKLLRVLQEGEFDRIGGTKPIKVDVRVIAATNRHLEQLVQEGKFRQDLYYRLNVFPIYNIPLRERRDDIPLLVQHFVQKFSQKMGRPITNIPQKAVDKLMHYSFPGNVRELENIIERAVILSTNQTLNIEAAFDFSAAPTTAKVGEVSIMTPGTFKSLEDLQRDYIIEALRYSGGQVSGENGAAMLLQMNDKTLYSKIKKLNIQKEEYLD